MATAPTRTKQVKTGEGIKPVPRPTCRTHAKLLAYLPDELLWRCPVQDCRVIKRPEVTGNGLTVLSGDMELVKIHSSAGTDLYLRLMKYGVMVRITDVSSGFNYDQQRMEYTATISMPQMVEATI